MKITERVYKQSEVITFSNTKGEFGGLSNMAPNYSVFVNEVIIRNIEALYQACRFPLFPDIQEEILRQTSPMVSKEIARKYSSLSRQDWDTVKFSIMRWCLLVKLLQNKETFGTLLKKTRNKTIVEYSVKDKVWAAVSSQNGTLVGKNALGRLLMDIRQKYIINETELESIQPLSIPAFLLFNNPIGKIHKPEYFFSDFD